MTEHRIDHTIELGRANIVLTVGMLIFLAGFVFFAVLGGLDAVETSSRVLSFGLAAVFAVPLLLLLRALPKLLSPRAILVGPDGLSLRHGKETIVIAWAEIATVGIGYAVPARERPPSTFGPEMMQQRLADAAAEALQISRKRQYALEIFPVRPDIVDRHPRLKPYWKHLPPPVAGLSPLRWQFPLPAVTPIVDQIANALYTLVPRSFFGFFPVPWRGKQPS